MSVIAFKQEASPSELSSDEASSDDDGSTRPSFWYRLAAAIDSIAAYPVQHALSEREKRYVDDEIARCRQLMFTHPRPLYAAVRHRVRP